MPPFAVQEVPLESVFKFVRLSVPINKINGRGELTDETTGRAGGPADHDLVLPARGRLGRVVAAALAFAPEQIVVPVAVVHEPSLARRRALGRVRDLCGRSGVLGRRRVELGLVDVAPERPKDHVRVAVGGGDHVGVDGVVALARAGRNAGRSVVGPAPVLERRRGRVADGAVLGSERRDRVVQVVCVVDEQDVGSPQIIVSSEVDRGAGGDGRAVERPGAGQRRGTVDADLATGAEAEIGAVASASDGWVVCPTLAGASARVGVGRDGADEHRGGYNQG